MKEDDYMENNSRKLDNKVDKLIKNFSLAIIFILVISLIISLININNLKNSQKSFNSLIGGISLMVVPYMAISIVTQVIIFVLTFFKKKIKLFFFIISLVIEIIFLIFTNFCVIPYMFFNFLVINIFLSYFVVILFEVVNVILICLMIKRIINCKSNV